jgi:anti-anti-sigma factor
MDDNIVVDITLETNIAVVAFRDTSISNSEAIAEAAAQIKDFIARKHPSRIVFDFGSVRFFSSQVLGLLLDIRSILEGEGEVVISAIEPKLYRVFKITNLDKIFRFFPDKESAVEAVRN